MMDLERRRMPVSGGELSYIDEGDSEDPTLLFLHGFPTSSYLWREFIPLFAPWMHVLVPDLLGCGESAKPLDAPLDIRAQVGYVRELLAKRRVGRLAVVGHGHGGGIAQLLALEGLVEALVLVDSIAFDAWPSESTRRLQQLPPGERTEAIFNQAFERFLHGAVGKPERLTDDLRRAYLTPFRGEEGTRAFFRGIDAADGMGLAGTEDGLASLTCPTLIVWGEDDPYLPEAVAERLNDAIHTSSLAVLPGCSHLLPEDAPETVAPLAFDYLRSRYLGEAHSHVEPGTVPIVLERRPPAR